METAPPHYRRLAGVVLAAWWTLPAAFGQDAENLQPRDERIEQLERTVEQLMQELGALKGEIAEEKAERETAAEATAAEKAKQPKIELGKSGFRVTSPDGDFQLRLRLRLLHDFAWFNQDKELERVIGEEQDGTDFRAARIRLEGKAWDDFSFVGEFDFAGQSGEDSPKFRDVYLQYNGVPYFGGNQFDVRVGHFKEPFSLDELISITDRTFLENPLTDVFVPSRNVGIQLSDALLGEPGAERLTWQIGLFKETDDIPSSNDSDDDQGYQFTGRITGLPWYADEGRKLLHLGFGYSHRNPDGARLRYGVRPESRLALFRYVDPDNLPVGFRLRDARADDVDLFAPEAALVLGPFSLQGEYVLSKVDTTFGGDVDLSGYYAQASYIFTGEHRPYRHDRGTFDSPVPLRNFAWRGDEKGWGAWEIAARYSHVDMQDGPIRGGEHTAYTLGLNWYLNPNLRISWNYIHNDVEHDLYDGDFDVLQTRFQLEF